MFSQYTFGYLNGLGTGYVAGLVTVVVIYILYRIYKRNKKK